MGRAERSNFANSAKASLLCCQQVRRTLARILLRAGAIGCAIASPSLASHRHRADRPLAEVVGGMQPRTVQKGEQVRLFMAQVLGQSPIGRAAKVSIQQAVQLSFQPSGGYRQAMGGYASFPMAISQPESLLQQGFDGQGEWGGCRRGDPDHFATTPHQAIQAALMKRLPKPLDTSCFVMNQKTVVVFSQNSRRLRIPAMRF